MSKRKIMITGCMTGLVLLAALLSFVLRIGFLRAEDATVRAHHHVETYQFPRIEEELISWYSTHDELPGFISEKEVGIPEGIGVGLSYLPDLDGSNSITERDRFGLRDVHPDPSYGVYQTENQLLLVSSGPDYEYNPHPRDWFTDETTMESPELVSRSYDPSNGTYSSGDIYYIVELPKLQEKSK